MSGNHRMTAPKHTGRRLSERVATMTTTISTQLSNRDRAVLRAVAEGRCTVARGCGSTLVIDGFCCSDQFVGPRLASAGLIAVGDSARLTPSGLALLQAA